MKLLSEILANHKDRKAKQFGPDFSERVYPVSAVLDIAEEYKDQHVKSLVEQNAELTAALLKVRDRHIKNPITYNIITKALNYEK